jgi:hypothetical protein
MNEQDRERLREILAEDQESLVERKKQEAIRKEEQRKEIAKTDFMGILGVE